MSRAGSHAAAGLGRHTRCLRVIVYPSHIAYPSHGLGRHTRCLRVI